MRPPLPFVASVLLFESSTSFLYSVPTKASVIFEGIYPINSIKSVSCNDHNDNNNINISFSRNRARSQQTSYYQRNRIWATSASEDTNLENVSDGDNAYEDLTDEDWKILSMIVQQSKYNVNSTDNDQALKEMEKIVFGTIAQMHPRLILALRQAAERLTATEDENLTTTITNEQHFQLETVGKVLIRVMDEKLNSARELLTTLLESGEVRQLDGAIGKASRESKLDMAFFTVLNMNLGDAALEDQKKLESKGGDNINNDGKNASSPSRFQILQHIYTRCQEEVEKTVSPGVGLLNKLLRTEETSIRSNQLRHFLVPEENVVSTADGSELKLKGTKALVPPEDLIEAITDSVRKVQEVEKTGVTDRVTAAGLIESCRQIAIEARVAIGEGYGVDSEILKKFEDELQPVFRPT